MNFFVKYILAYCCWILLFSVSFSQTENAIHTGDIFKINSGTEIYFLGNFTDSSSSFIVTNKGDMYFKGDITNNGTKNIFGSVTNDGSVHFIGNSSSINGTDSINFHNLELAFSANTDTLILNKFIIVNDSLVLTQGDIQLNDSLELLYLATVSSPGGIINESNDNRIYGPSFIKFENGTWGSIGVKTYEDLKNLGLRFEVTDALGLNTPTLYRYNAIQDCGSTHGSVDRTFQFENISDPNGQAQDFSMKYHIPMEQGFLPNANDLHIYYTKSDKDAWTDIGGTSNTSSVDNTSAIKQLNNTTFITVARDSCDYIPFLEVNQINTFVTPIDTLFNVSSASSCDSSDVSLQVVGDPGIYTWIKPDNSTLPSNNGMLHTFSDLGTYQIVLEDKRGCYATKTITLTSAPNGNAGFTPNSPNLCDGTSFSFVPDSTHNPAYTYEWDLDGNGTYETTNYQIGSHTFSGDGVHNIGLSVTTNLGCKTTTTEQVIIQPIPVASFTATTACPGANITFDNNSIANALAGVTIDWDFQNDGNNDLSTSGNGQGVGGDAQFSYPSEGVYTVSIVATSNGCTSLSFTSNVTVQPEPNPNFTFTNACENQAVQFTNASTISDFSSMTYDWNFNTPIGPNSTLDNPTYTYATTNSYNVSLEATSSYGCSHDTTIVVSIDENPVANFSFTDECINTQVTFVDNSTVGSGSISSWSWNFGNSNTSSNQNDIQSYATSGNYNITLSVATSQGCAASTTQSITIFDGPVVSYVANNQCIGNQVSFTNTSTNATTYQWTFPSLSQTATTNSPIKTFTSAGWHTALLEATSSNGCIGNYVDSVEIYPIPNIGLGATNATCGNSLVLDATDNGNNAGATYFWSTGASTAQYNATYNGSFNVSVTSADGCVNTDTTIVTLNANVTPNISNQSACDMVTLDPGYVGSTFAWTGPGGFTATTQTIDVTTLGASTYSVTITDQNGCTGTASSIVTISTSSLVNLGPDQTNCVGQIIVLDAGTPGSTYNWNTVETSQAINATQDGFYSVILTNVAGCISGDTVQLSFNTAPVFDLGTDAAFCVSHNLNSFSPNATYLWNDLSTGSNLNATTTGQYDVVVTNIITNCVAYDTINLVINPLPIVNIGSDTTLCSYNNVTVDAGNTGATFNWNTGATTQTVNIASSGLYSVEVTDANGCLNTDQINILVNPIFGFDLGVDRPFCDGSNLTLSLDTTFPSASYNWYNTAGNLTTDSSYIVIDTGVIYLGIVDQYGCQATDSITILPSTLSLHAQYLSDSEVLVGDSLVFIDLSYPKPYTLIWDMDNGYTTTDSIPQYVYFTPGDYDVSLTVNNGFCESIRTKTITVSPIKMLESSVEVADLFSTIEYLNLYPNPNNGMFKLKIRLTEESAVQVDVYNILGQQTFTEKFIAKEIIKEYNFRDLQRGVYILKVSSGKESKTVKFVKINH